MKSFLVLLISYNLSVNVYFQSPALMKNGILCKRTILLM